MARKWITEKIAGLDPQKDYQQIVFLLTCYVFPWDIERALEFALYRTYAVPTISALLAQTEEFTRRTRKRYDDTELILYELAENGFDSERGKRALRRMNQMHGRYPIANLDFLYVLSTFIFEPIRWVERFGWRPFTHNEKSAWFNYYREMGHYMNIKDLPLDIDEFEQFNRCYEQEHFRFAAANAEIGQPTRDMMLGFYLPKSLYGMGKPFVHSFMDPPLLEAMGFPQPAPLLGRFGAAALRARGRLLKWTPERKSPVLGTRRKRPTYPQGYQIEDLGTFADKR